MKPRQGFGARLRRNFAAGGMLAAGSAIVSFFAYPLYLSYLGYKAYGLWLVLASLMTLGQLSDLGITSSLAKFVAEEYGRENRRGSYEFMTTACFAVTGLGSIAAVALILFRPLIETMLGLRGSQAVLFRELLPWVAFLTVYTLVVELYSATLIGVGRMDLSCRSKLISQTLGVLISGLLLFAGFGVPALYVGMLLSYVILHVQIARHLTLSIGPRESGMVFFDRAKLRVLLSLGGWLFGTFFVYATATPVNKIILARYAGLAAVPIYEVALTGSMRIRGLIETGLRALTPEISMLQVAMDEFRAQRIRLINRSVMWGVAALGALAYTPLFLFAEPILRAWLRARYVDALPTVFRLMLIGTFCSLLSLPAFYTLIGIGKARTCFIAAVAASAASFFVIACWLRLTGTVSPQTMGYGVIASSIVAMFQLMRLHHFLGAIDAEQESAGANTCLPQASAAG